MPLADLVELQQPGEVMRFHTRPVQLNPAELGTGPVQALSDLFFRKTRTFAKSAHFGGEPTATDGRAAILRHPSDPFLTTSRTDYIRLSRAYPNWCSI
jgi:hypothetical protein